MAASCKLTLAIGCDRPLVPRSTPSLSLSSIGIATAPAYELGRECGGVLHLPPAPSRSPLSAVPGATGNAGHHEQRITAMLCSQSGDAVVRRKADNPLRASQITGSTWNSRDIASKMAPATFLSHAEPLNALNVARSIKGLASVASEMPRIDNASHSHSTRCRRRTHSILYGSKSRTEFEEEVDR